MNDSNKHIVEIDGEQVFTANWVHTQMMAKSCRIDSVKNIAVISIVCSVISLLTAIISLVK